MHKAYLGEENAATVYAAELLGILMTVKIAVKARQPMFAISTDNQAALKTITAPKRQSGQHIVKRTIQSWTKAERDGIHIKLQ